MRRKIYFVMLVCFLFGFIVFLFAADTAAVTNTGKKVVLHDDGTWSNLDEQIKKIDDIKSKIEITVLESKIYTSYDGQKLAGYSLKIKNNSEVTIYELQIRIYFYDKTGKPFFEQNRYPVDDDGFSSEMKILRPNYSFLFPEAGKYYYADKLDVSEWAEGKIRVEVTGVRIEPKA